jgi:hypothetical protein
MKLTPILGSFLFATVLTQAQSQRVEPGGSPPNEPRKSTASVPVARDQGREADLVIVGAGKLIDVVKALEERRPSENETKPWVMPNVIFAPGAEDAKVPAPTRLRGVSPAQALALVAAAAGCELEPLLAPSEQGERADEPRNADLVPPKIIGYRITPVAGYGYGGTLTATASVTPTAQPEESGGVGISLAPEGGALVVQDVVQGMPAWRSKTITKGDHLLSVTNQNDAEVKVSTLPLQKATELIRGKPGTTVKLKLAPNGNEQQAKVVELTREKLAFPPPSESRPVVTAYGPFGTPPGDAIHRDASIGNFYGQGKNPADFGQKLFSTSPNLYAGTASGTSIVRIYPLGKILDGSSKEASESKEIEFRELIAEALNKSDLDAKTPDLSFHTSSKVLVAKATAAQHEIIQQVVTAMRENEAPASAARQ